MRISSDYVLSFGSLSKLETLNKSLPAAWCGAGADPSESLVDTVLEDVTPDKAAVVL